MYVRRRSVLLLIASVAIVAAMLPCHVFGRTRQCRQVPAATINVVDQRRVGTPNLATRLGLTYRQADQRLLAPGKSTDVLTDGQQEMYNRAMQRLKDGLVVQNGKPFYFTFTPTQLFQKPTEYTNDDIRLVQFIPSITVLQLNGRNVDDESLLAASLLPQIRSLQIESNAITGIGVGYLKSLRHIESLSVAPIDDDGTRHAATVGTPAFEDGLCDFVKCCAIQRISLSGKYCTNAALESLAVSKSLKDVTLTCREVNTRSLRRLAALDTLKTVVLYDTFDALEIDQVFRGWKRSDLAPEGPVLLTR